MATIKQYSKELYDLMDFFERSAPKLVYCGGFEREKKELWLKGFYYANGNVNNLFRLFMAGYTFGKSQNEE